MIELKIKPLMDAKGMSMKDMERASGVSYNTVRTWYYNQVNSLNFDNLESICKALDCTPNDILISDTITYNKPTDTTHQNDIDDVKKQLFGVEFAVPSNHDIAIAKDLLESGDTSGSIAKIIKMMEQQYMAVSPFTDIKKQDKPNT